MGGGLYEGVKSEKLVGEGDFGEIRGRRKKKKKVKGRFV